jgi:DNA polymerase
MRQIEIIDPKVVATLGRFSMNYFLPEAKITRDHGRTMLADGRIIFPMFHPAAALRSPEMMKALKEDFAKLPDVVAGKGANSIVLPPAMAEKQKPERPKQGSLF